MLSIDRVIEEVSSVSEQTFIDDVCLRLVGDIKDGVMEFLFNYKERVPLDGNLISIYCDSYEGYIEGMVDYEVIETKESVSFKSTKMSLPAKKIASVKFYNAKLLVKRNDNKDYILLLE